MPTSPSPITALDGITPPSRSDPTNFRARGDATLGALPALISQLVALAVTAYNNAVDAAASAIAAAGAATAPLWVSGATVTQWSCVISPATRLIYRRFTATGSGVTDPSVDTANYALANPAQLTVVNVAGTTQMGAAGFRYRFKNSALSTGTLPAAPADGDTIAWSAANGRVDNVIARNGKLIGGLAEDLTQSFAGETTVLCYDSAAGSWEIVNV